MRKIALFFTVTSFLTPAVFADVNTGNLLSQQRKFVEQSNRVIKKPVVKKQQQEMSVASIKEFTLERVNIDGNQTLTDKELDAVVAKYLNSKVGGKQVNEILKDIRSLYHEEGVLLPIVTLTGYGNGDLNISVVEGKIRNVEVAVSKEDEKALYANSLITKYIDKILASSPAKTKDVQRYLLLLNKVPGYSFEYELIPVKSQDKAENEVADMILRVEKKMVAGELVSNSYGTGDLGRYQFSVLSSVYNMLGWNDTLMAGYTTTNDPDRLKSITAGYLKRLNSYGTSASVLWSYTLDNGFANGAKDDVGTDLKAQISHYLVMNNNNAFRLDLGVDYRTAKQYTPGVWLDSYEYVQGFVGARMKHKDFLGGENLLNPYYYTALGGVHIKKTASSLINFGKHFSSAKVDYYRDQPLPQNFSIFSHVVWSGSQDNIPPEQQFFVDGIGVGRGYKPGIITSNSGINGDIELRYTNAIEDNKLIEASQLFGFYNITHFSKLQTVVDKKTINSAGGGVRLFFPYGIKGEFEIDFPFSKSLTVGGVKQDMPNRYQFLISKSFNW